MADYGLCLWLVDIDDQHVKNEQHKEDSLKKQKDGKGHWKPELASDSEEAACFPLFLSPASPLILSTCSSWC